MKILIPNIDAYFQNQIGIKTLEVSFTSLMTKVVLKYAVGLG